MQRVVIIGSAGYSGAELTTLLWAHPGVDLVGLFGSSGLGDSQRLFSDEHPRWRGIIDDPIYPTDPDAISACEADAVFLATPHDVSHDQVPSLLDRGMTVFDLSAAYRLKDLKSWSSFYGSSHKHPELVAQAAYGLAERNSHEIAQAELIAVPGCYPTSVILPLAPLVDAAAVDTSGSIVADSASGVSGAGRSPRQSMLYCEVSYGPYSVLRHRHTPEIEEHSGANVIFTPHLVPVDRGIVSTIHIQLASGWNESAVREVYRCYDKSPFIRVLSNGAWPSMAAVRGTNFCDIGLAVDETRRHLVVVSAIDNLLKGAAGQAVQCYNIRFGHEPTLGLPGGAPCSMHT